MSGFEGAAGPLQGRRFPTCLSASFIGVDGAVAALLFITGTGLPRPFSASLLLLGVEGTREFLSLTIAWLTDRVSTDPCD